VNEKTRPPTTTYDEREVAELLRRASALEQKRKLERPTLTLQEVEEIAREAGLDPQLVRRAATELQHQPPQTLWTRLAGAPTTHTIERVIDGELSTEDHEAVASAIRDALGSGGFPVQLATLGRSLSLTTFSNSGLLDLQVTPKDGTTRIRITVNVKQLAGGLFGGLIGGIGGGLGSNVAWVVPLALSQAGFPVVVGVAGGAAGLLATVTGAWALARWLFVGRARAGFARADQLAETIEGLLRANIAKRAGVTAVS
jgi:hypothetical protein